MKKCLSYYNCMHCCKRAECETYQLYKRYVGEAKTIYEQIVAHPEKFQESTEGVRL